MHEVEIFCITLGILMCASMFGLGIAIGREAGRHERVDKDNSECGVKCEHADRSVHTVADMGVDRNCVSDDKGAVSVRGSDRQDIRPFPKEIENDGLAAILRALAFTSTLSSDEKAYIREAADRLEEKESSDERDSD